MRYQQLTRATGIPHRSRVELLRCWADASMAGGAIGLPPGPVSDADVALLARPLFQAVVGGRARLLLAVDDDDSSVVGWLAIVLNTGTPFAHWAELQRLQVRPEHQRSGAGSGLVVEAERIAREELGLEQLRLSARSGHDLEPFYEGLGWKEIGRHPGAVRVGPDDDRDEVFFLRRL